MVSKKRIVTQRKGSAEIDHFNSKIGAWDPSPVPSNSADEQANAPTRMETYLNRVAPEILAVTYWFEPLSKANVSSYTIRLIGKRLDVTDRAQPADRFNSEVTVNGIVDDSGPVAVLAKIEGVNPGTWEVSARMVPPPRPATGYTGSRTKPFRVGGVPPVYRAAWSWRKWKLLAEPTTPIETCLAPFAKPPAVILGSWAVLVAVGIAAALGTQLWIVDSLKLDPGRVLIASIISILAGGIGAKLWFIVLHLHEKRREGWCLQGMVAGIVVAFPALLEMLHLPIASVIDASTPGIMIGLAIGRLGCFFTGCCAGRPTRSRWGVWSSDRCVGMRRIPTQLMESGLAFLIGVTVFTAIHFENTFHGALFVAALSAYTLIRQGLLRLRLERRKSRLGGPFTAIVAAVVLAGMLVLLIAGWS